MVAAKIRTHAEIEDSNPNINELLTAVKHPATMASQRNSPGTTFPSSSADPTIRKFSPIRFREGDLHLHPLGQIHLNFKDIGKDLLNRFDVWSLNMRVQIRLTFPNLIKQK